LPQITVRAVAASQQFVPPFLRTAYTAVSKGKNPLPDSRMTRREAGFLQFSGRFFDIAPGWPSGRMGRSGPTPHNRSLMPQHDARLRADSMPSAAAAYFLHPQKRLACLCFCIHN
jgi:hypothetical protein